MPILLTTNQASPIITASRRNDIEGLSRGVANFAEDFGTIKGEILLGARDENGNTTLHAASEFGHTDVLHWTLSTENFPLQPGLRATFIGLKNALGDTALNTAARHNRAVFLAALLAAGAYPSVYNGFGFTALHYAVQNNSEAVTAILLTHGASPRVRARSGDTPLHIATRSQNLRISERLLRKAAPTDWCNAAGDAPLHVAVRTGDWPLILQLLNFGAPINQNNRVNGDTPLHAAVRAWQVDVVERFLHMGANWRDRNENGLTPYELARLKGSEDVQAVFLNFGRW